MIKKQQTIAVLDLFAGAGGFGLGFKFADKKYKIICSLEIDKWAVETLSANNIDGHLILQRDIREFDTPEKINNACPERPIVIIGGPPCQGFSVAGPVKDPKDPRNSLFKNYAQWVDVFKPKVFVMENVRGLLSMKNESGEKVIDIVCSTFEKIGYTVNVWELNAAHYGVPQSRERIFVVGSLAGKKIPPPPRTHFLPEEKAKLNGSIINLKQAITVIDAIGDLPILNAGEGNELLNVESQNIDNLTEYQKSLRGHEKHIYNHVTMAHTKRIVNRYRKIIGGSKLNEMEEELKVRKRNGNGQLSTTVYSSNYRHLKSDMVAYTIPASFYSNFVHPNQPRNITSREAARLQSFPDSYIFKGKRTQISSKLLKRLGKDEENFLSQYNQIGNAVPPLLAKAIGIHILKHI